MPCPLLSAYTLTQAVFAAEAEAYKSLIGQLLQDLDSTSRGLNTLGLAPDSE